MQHIPLHSVRSTPPIPLLLSTPHLPKTYSHYTPFTTPPHVHPHLSTRFARHLKSRHTPSHFHTCPFPPLTIPTLPLPSTDPLTPFFPSFTPDLTSHIYPPESSIHPTPFTPVLSHLAIPHAKTPPIANKRYPLSPSAPTTYNTTLTDTAPTYSPNINLNPISTPTTLHSLTHTAQPPFFSLRTSRVTTVHHIHMHAILPLPAPFPLTNTQPSRLKNKRKKQKTVS